MKQNKIEIPIYRAKKINSDEYVVGFYAYDECHKRHLIMTNNIHGLHETIVDPTTLAIHFNDMLDSKGNKIFASLDEYMLKGASIVENNMFDGDYMIQHAVYSENCLCIMDKDGEKYNIYENGYKLKAIGIQE